MAVVRDTDAMFVSPSSPSSPQTTSFTVGAGSNRFLVVWLNWLRSTTPEFATITYNGTTVNLNSNYVFSGGPYGSLWGLVAPSTGSNTVSITDASNTTFTAMIYSANGVDQVTPFGTVSSDITGIAGSTSYSLAPASAVGDLMLHFLNTNGLLVGLAASGTGATIRRSGNDSAPDLDGVGAMMDQTAAAGTTTGGMTWTGGATGVAAAVALKQAAAAGIPGDEGYYLPAAVQPESMATIFARRMVGWTRRSSGLMVPA